MKDMVFSKEVLVLLFGVISLVIAGFAQAARGMIF